MLPASCHGPLTVLARVDEAVIVGPKGQFWSRPREPRSRCRRHLRPAATGVGRAEDLAVVGGEQLVGVGGVDDEVDHLVGRQLQLLPVTAPVFGGKQRRQHRIERVEAAWSGSQHVQVGEPVAGHHLPAAPAVAGFQQAEEVGDLALAVGMSGADQTTVARGGDSHERSHVGGSVGRLGLRLDGLGAVLGDAVVALVGGQQQPVAGGIHRQ